MMMAVVVVFMISEAGDDNGRQHWLKWVKGKRSRLVCPAVQQEEVESIPASSCECTIVQCVHCGLTEEEPIEIQIKRRKWRWIGHTLRKPNKAIERQALEWNPQGARKLLSRFLLLNNTMETFATGVDPDLQVELYDLQSDIFLISMRNCQPIDFGE
ncbi:hypothetical protein ANN_08312 [Periplaneta americana]|uniref:Uncharacterized protein n=1 Tax=Periplaneta americana TaxID=6978 RepID=A0ABQ8T129_PERAM|nr:hypothetical protein ANN_08312 [Periplaneta americana]